VEHLKTCKGVAFGLIRAPQKHAPTLFVLCSCTIDTALDDRFAGRCAKIMLDKGFNCVSIDIPCHGAEHRADEPAGLDGWSFRAKHKEDFVSESNDRLSGVLDYLIERRIADPEKVAVCGTSRGGFLALHFAAHDKRVRCTAAFAPVTDLRALREFRGQTNDPFVSDLSLQSNVERLAGHPAWIVIGDQDDRVGTDLAMEFSRSLTKVSLRQQKPSRGELHVLNEPRGHTLPDHVSEDAAAWICEQMK
jgi:dienelactone hydrolase